MIKYFILISISALIYNANLNNGAHRTPPNLVKNYIFIGHCYDYQSGGTRVDPRVEQINVQSYDRIWLGGDVCSEAFLKKSTVQHIDDVFDLSKVSTQYALGNHDIRNGNMQWYKEFSGRKTYNHYSSNGVISICMNSQLNPGDCRTLNEQYQLISNICDTVSISKHLFLLMHSNPLTGISNLPPATTYSHSNYENWNANCDSSNTYFKNTIYPKLVDVKTRGIDVYVIIGDAGTNVKQFHQVTTDSIHVFASGLYNSAITDPVILAQAPKDKVLIFNHDLTSQEMTWKFHDLDSLVTP